MRDDDIYGSNSGGARVDYRAQFDHMGEDELRLIASHLPVQSLVAMSITNKLCGNAVHDRMADIHNLHEAPFNIQLKDIDLAKRLDLSSRNLSDQDMRVFSEALRNGALAQLEHLDLRGNNFGLDGIKAFAAAIKDGALKMLQKIHINFYQLSKEARYALCEGFGLSKRFIKKPFVLILDLIK